MAITRFKDRTRSALRCAAKVARPDQLTQPSPSQPEQGRSTVTATPGQRFLSMRLSRVWIAFCVGATLTACGSQASFQSHAASATPTAPTAGASLATSSPTPSATGVVSGGGPLFVAEESHTRLGTINLLGQPAPYDVGGVMCSARVVACAP